jgi:hypothetical protein
VADRAERSSLLRFALPALLVAAIILTSTPAAEAHNTWNGGYRKWPWRGTDDRTLTTLPGECPHCPGVETPSASKAIDVAMNYETVYSTSPGTISIFTTTGGKAGTYIQVKDADGSYITYEHLSKALVTSGAVVAGQPLAVSGCSGNCDVAHLHFQRQDGTSFYSNALSLTPISGHGGSGDPLMHASYTSDNAGIGYYHSGSFSTAIQNAYKAGGGYKTIGVTADIGVGWSPCRYEGVRSQWWRYVCAPRSGISGSVQTFYDGSDNLERAIMLEDGTTTAYVVQRGILAAYTDPYNGHDWVYWIGYPTSNRYSWNGWLRQNFRYGYVLFDQWGCLEWFYIGSTWTAESHYCDS